MKKLFLFLSFLVINYGVLFAEDITITTYYPSPFGSYNELTANQMKIGAAYSGSGTAFKDDSLLVEGNVGIGTPDPQNKLDIEGAAVIGAAYSGTNTAPANGLLVQGNVGIGTAIPAPAYKLDIAGSARSTDFYLTDGVQIQGLSGRNYFRDSEAAGNLRVGALWGMPGIYAEAGIGAVGGANGTSLQNNSLFVTTGGNVGIGTTTPAVRLDLAGGTMRGALECIRVAGPAGYGGSWATCGANYFLVSGGGVCANGSFAYLHASYPNGNSWVVDCYRHDGAGDDPATAFALCCRKQ